MAYVPTLADTQEAIAPPAGYTPTLADTQEALANPNITASPLGANPSLVPRVAGDIDAGLAQAGQGLHNFLARALTPILGKYAPSPTNINFSQTFGINQPNLADRLVQGGAAYTPYAMTAAEAVPARALGLGARIAQQALTGGLYGATQSANPVQGALTGQVVGGLSEAIPDAIGNSPQLMARLQPKRLANKIMQVLSGGRSLEENGQSLAQDIQNAFQNRTTEGAALYKPVFDQVGNDSIYNGINQANVRLPAKNFNNLEEVIDHINDTQGTNLENAGDLKDYLMQQHGLSFPGNKSVLGFFNSYPATVNNGAYQQLAPDILNSYDRDLTTLHNTFNANPTFQNAHNLQSQLGGAIRDLQATNAKSGLTPLDRSTLQGYQRAQGALKSDMNDYLNAKNPALAQQYQQASAHWAQNVAPYLENPKLTQIAKGDLTNPGNVATLFKNPEPETQQIVNDMGNQAKNKIVYSQLGKLGTRMTPEKLSNAISDLDKQGLGSYVSPELAQQNEDLASRIKMRDLAQQIGGAIGGGMIGAKLGIPYGETIGTLGGAIGGHFLRDLRLPSILNPAKLATVTQGANHYAMRPLGNAIRAALINEGGQ